MLRDIFFAFFVITAFIYMSVTAWQNFISALTKRLSASDETEESNNYKELLFLLLICVAITVLSILVTWGAEKSRTEIDVEKMNMVFESLELADVG